MTGLSPASQASTVPYASSTVIAGITWHTDTLAPAAPGSDLWPNTWADDDNVYTSWGDGGGFGGTNSDGRVSLGFARVEGAPESFAAANVWGGKNPEHPAQFGGKVVGMISIAGTLYAWLNTQDSSTPSHKLVWSTDHAATWTQSSWSFSSDTFTPATFLNFGKDYAGARDDYVYSYGGQWGYADEIYLVRVPKDQIKDKAAYTYFAGSDGTGNPIWSADIGARQPVFVDPNSMNEVNATLKATVIYNAGIGRYLLTTSHGGTGGLGIFDAPEPWGPWTTAAYYDNWIGAASAEESLVYGFVNKWTSSDGLTAWMIFSGYSGDQYHDRFNLIKATLSLVASPTPTDSPTPLPTNTPSATP